MQGKSTKHAQLSTVTPDIVSAASFPTEIAWAGELRIVKSSKVPEALILVAQVRRIIQT
jgi:hypothetical protein